VQLANSCYFDHVSFTYFTVANTNDSYNPILSFNLSLLLLQTFEMLPKVAFAFPSLILISLSLLLSLDYPAAIIATDNCECHTNAIMWQ